MVPARCVLVVDDPLDDCVELRFDFRRVGGQACLEQGHGDQRRLPSLLRRKLPPQVSDRLVDRRLNLPVRHLRPLSLGRFRLAAGRMSQERQKKRS